MKKKILELLGKNFDGNPPAIASKIAAAERGMQHSLPEDFREFLESVNGGEGMLGDEYLMLWPINEIEQYNASYQVTEYAPGLLLFGSDGGGEAYAFDMRSSPPQVVSVPFVGMSLAYAKIIAPSFIAFLQVLRS